MIIINYISTIAVPFVIFFIVSYGVCKKIKIFDSFLIGCSEGMKTVINIFPTLIGLFLAISALRCSGILDFISSCFAPLLSKICFPVEVFPLALVRPISGSASTAIATDIIKQYGVDTILGKIASVIMGSTETTFYIIAIYTSHAKVNNIRFVLVSALIADLVGIASSVIFCHFLS